MLKPLEAKDKDMGPQCRGGIGYSVDLNLIIVEEADHHRVDIVPAIEDAVSRHLDDHFHLLLVDHYQDAARRLDLMGVAGARLGVDRHETGMDLRLSKGVEDHNVTTDHRHHSSSRGVMDHSVGVARGRHVVTTGMEDDHLDVMSSVGHVMDPTAADTLWCTSMKDLTDHGK
ncbi:hypothetical protein V7S43_018599 [Phytophthora oleae]|uniref:Uncharacterized protein n=1 Tax=Phytophthora oleae TaxID=2107226 RepID=A0ABD3EQN8_9STRA